jgi:hypothetical protein
MAWNIFDLGQDGKKIGKNVRDGKKKRRDTLQRAPPFEQDGIVLFFMKN